MSAPEHAVVVGASLAGLRGAESLRRAGFTGRLIIVGAESHRPYDRPPLSKQVLTGEVAPEASTLPVLATLDAEWRLGVPATRLDRAARTLHLADGETIAYDRLLIATGARARSWPNPHEARYAGVHTVRDRDDANRLRAAFVAGPKRVLVIGGGFIGCEVAHAARRLGLAVTLVEPSATPLARVLGTHLGAVVGHHLETSGVELRSGVEVEWLEDDGHGRLVRAHLTDGNTIETGVAVVALGAVRNTDWLAGSGLSFDARGVDCDEHARALDEQGRPDGAVFAAGDVARFPHPLYGRRVALEHWEHAVAQGEYAGAMMAGANPQGPYGGVPAFWSVQGDLNIKSAGLTEGADAVVIAQGDPKTGRFLAVYGREGRCIAAVSFDMARWLPIYAEMIGRKAPFPPIRGAKEQGRLKEMEPGFP